VLSNQLLTPTQVTRPSRELDYRGVRYWLISTPLAFLPHCKGRLAHSSALFSSSGMHGETSDTQVSQRELAGREKEIRHRAADT